VTSAEAAANDALSAERARARAELDRAVAKIEEGRGELARQKGRESALGEKLAQVGHISISLSMSIYLSIYLSMFMFICMCICI